MRASRSLLWRVIGWLLPVLLILVGLVFVTASLTNTDTPKDIPAPPNVRDVTRYNAPGWALRQVAAAGMGSEVIGVVMVDSAAKGAASYTVRAVIVRVDGPPTPATAVRDTLAIVPEAAVQTVFTCVKWAVDVSTGAIVEHGAIELSRSAGHHGIGDSGKLRNACAHVAFPG